MADTIEEKPDGTAVTSHLLQSGNRSSQKASKNDPENSQRVGKMSHAIAKDQRIRFTVCAGGLSTHTNSCNILRDSTRDQDEQEETP